MKKLVIATLLSSALLSSAFAFDKDHSTLTFSKSQGPYSELFISGVQPILEKQGYTVKGIDIIDNEANDSDLMALYPEWAQKGYIEITEDNKKVLTFTKLKELPDDVPEYQKILFKRTFSRSKTFRMKNIGSTYVNGLQKAKESLGDSFDEGRF